MPYSKTDIREMTQTLNRLRGSREQFDDHWQRLAELMLPRRADFKTQRPQGSRRLEHQYDSVPMLAARGLASAIEGMLMPRTSQWFSLQADDTELNERDDVKRWFFEVEKRMRRAIYDRRARFSHATAETSTDLTVFGSACLFIGESTRGRHLYFRNFHLKGTYFVRDAEWSVREVWLVVTLTAQQALWEFAGSRLPAAQKAIEAKEPNRRFDYLQIVRPRERFSPRRLDAANMPIESVWVELESETLISESGFREWPFATPVWDSSSDEDYGRSPGMLALPDSNTAQAMQLTLLKAGQKAVDPPLAIANDSVIGAVRTSAGGLTYFDAEAARMLGGHPPLFPLDLGKNMPIGIQMQDAVRDQIWSAFFKNVLALPVEGPEMTATEILERKDEFIRTIGPTFGRLEGDYPAPIVERVFAVLLRTQSLPPPPDVLQGRGVTFEFVSPIERVRKQIEAAGMARAVEVLAPFVNYDPTIMDNYDGDQIARGVSEAYGMPISWLRAPEMRDALRQQRQEAAAAQEEMAGMEQMAGAAQQFAQADASMRGPGNGEMGS